jgi:hypothetical protein
VLTDRNNPFFFIIFYFLALLGRRGEGRGGEGRKKQKCI